jgi:alpha-galactosidase
MHMDRLRACLLAVFVCLAATGILAPAAVAESNGLAVTPPMGWNDWYSTYCGVNAQLVEQTAQTMVANGMAAAGYQYVNIDDCWMAPARDSAGNLVPDPTRFPNGIKAVADYVHGLGLKLGIYEDAGTTTCAHLPGSYGHEAQDAATFASWGVDYLKYDRCNIPLAAFPGQSEQQVQQMLYTRMSRALLATGRPIVFSMCNPDPTDNPWTYGAPISNLWRTTTDIQNNFGSMMVNFEGTVDLFRAARPGAWNDPDLLQIGNGGDTPIEDTTEFSLWAEMAAPLIASTNISALSPAELAVYENHDVIAVDQDRLGRQGVPVSRAHGLWVLTKPLAGGDRAVVLFNSTNAAAKIATTAAAVGLRAGRSYRMQDLWSGSLTESGGAIGAFVPAHGVAMYRVGTLPRRHQQRLPVQTVLSLKAAVSQLQVGHSTTVWEGFSNDGITPVTGLKLSFKAHPKWHVKRLGPGRIARLASGHRFTVAYRVTAPPTGPPITVWQLNGTATYDPPGLRPAPPAKAPPKTSGQHGPPPAPPPAPRPQLTAAVSLGESVFAPVQPPLAAANTTNYAASFGASGDGLAISARGLGITVFNGSATDSYAAVYDPQLAGVSSTALVTVTSDQAGGFAGGAGLIERNAMTAPAGSPEGVALYVNNATIVMAWNASGGRNVDSRFSLPGVVRAPVMLQLARSGSTYTGYYSTNAGATWTPVDTVTVAAAASAGPQDVGVFHASGLSTWTTTAKFAGLSVH